MHKYLLTALMAVFFASTTRAQSSNSDTLKNYLKNYPFLRNKPDKKAYHPDSLHKPGKAVLRSAIIPGWGQLYNHQWYFVPVIYAGLGLLVDGIVFNEQNYKPTLLVAKDVEYTRVPSAADPEYKLYNEYKNSGQLTPAIVDNNLDSYRRDRDLCIMGFVAAWGVQVIQAYVQAKFEHTYTLDNDLSMRVSPDLVNQQQLYADSYISPVIPGVKLTFILR